MGGHNHHKNQQQRQEGITFHHYPPQLPEPYPIHNRKDHNSNPTMQMTSFAFNKTILHPWNLGPQNCVHDFWAKSVKSHGFGQAALLCIVTYPVSQRFSKSPCKAWANSAVRRSSKVKKKPFFFCLGLPPQNSWKIWRVTKDWKSFWKTNESSFALKRLLQGLRGNWTLYKGVAGTNRFLFILICDTDWRNWF